MIKGIAAILADPLAMRRSGVEHQHRVIGCVLGEYRKHLLLGAMIEMEKTVPGENAIEAPAERQFAHVGYYPLVLGQTAAAERNHCRRGVDAGHAQTALGHVLCDGASRAAAEVEHRRSGRKTIDEPVVPELVVPRGGLAVAIPFAGVPLVMADDEVW